MFGDLEAGFFQAFYQVLDQVWLPPYFEFLAGRCWEVGPL